MSKPEKNNKKPTILIFGGSFDPPHKGHQELIEVVVKRINPHKVIIVPCFLQPIKGEHHSKPEQRLKMCELQFRGFTLSDHEIRKSAVSYTVDTLKHFKKLYQESELFFIVGEDSFLDIENWKEPDRLLKLCRLLVVSRPGLVRKNLERKNMLEKLIEKYSSSIELIKEFHHPASSSQIRDEIKKNKSPKHLDSRVFDYIKSEGLYVGQDV